jgi:hypothetical protein
MLFAQARSGQLRLLIAFSICLLSISAAAQTFAKRDFPAATPSAGSLARADLNHDGAADLINAGGADVFVLVNNGDGTFRTPLQYNAGGGDVLKVMVADVNGDTHPDVIAAHGVASGTVQIAILRGNGDGTLQAPVQLPQTFANYRGFDLADFNRDGRQDLVVGFQAANYVNRMTVLYGNGSTFANPRDFTGFGKVSEPGENDYSLVAIAAGDYNGDGNPDISIGESGGGFDIEQSSISVFYGKGDGSFGAEVFEGGTSGLDEMQTVNANNDGIDDLAYIYSGCHTPCVGVGIAMGDPAGLGHKRVAQLPFTDWQNDRPRAVEFGDFTGDGRPDAVIAAEHIRESDGATVPAVLVSVQQADGLFSQVSELETPSWGTDLQAGDFNNDGKWDFVSSNGDVKNISVFLNTTAGIGCANPSANRTLNVCVPAAGATVASPVLFRANARSTTEISGMRIYVDGVSKFLTKDEPLTARVVIGPGTHNVTVKAWDAAGPFSKSFTLKVSGDSGTCQPASTARAVTICMPNPNDWQPTTVRFTANANGTNVRASQIYVDGSLKYETANYAIDTQLTLAEGVRHITVKGWDDLGSFSKSFTLWVYGGNCKPAVAPGGRGITVCNPNTAAKYNDRDGVPVQAIAVSPNTISSFRVQWENSAPREIGTPWIDERSFTPPGYNTWRFTATDSQGTMSKSVTVLVANAGCAAPSTRSVVICSPTNGQTVSGTFVLSASAGNPSGTFKTLQIYKDGAVWFQTNSPYIEIATGLPAGTHRITAKGWDASGAYSTTINVNSTGN